jgi:hypothetical protein
LYTDNGNFEISPFSPDIFTDNYFTTALVTDRSHPNIKQKDMQQINMNLNEQPLAKCDGYGIKEDTQFSCIESEVF